MKKRVGKRVGEVKSTFMQSELTKEQTFVVNEFQKNARKIVVTDTVANIC